MAHIENPKQMAVNLCFKYSALTNDSFITANGKLAAKIHVSDMIEEHNFKQPIGWNIERQKYWRNVSNEIDCL